MFAKTSCLLQDEPCAGLTLPGAAARAALPTPPPVESACCWPGVQGEETLVAWPRKEPRGLGEKAEEDCHACLRLFGVLTGRSGLRSKGRKKARPRLVLLHVTRGRVVAAESWSAHRI